MRSSWIRAWLAAVAVLVGAAALVRDRVDWLLAVEEPVLDWLLDGTDTSRWDVVQVVSNPTILVVGTIAMVLIGLFFDWRISAAVVITSVIGTVTTQVVQGLIGRTSPNGELGVGSFPSLEVVQTGVFWGLIVLMCWWLKLPKLVWQILVEVGIVLTIAVAVRQILNGDIWPSDAVGSAIVIVLSLITAALVFETNPVEFPWKRTVRNSEQPVAS